MIKQYTFEYQNRTYKINPHQLKILNTIKSLPKKHLHYLVVQQSNNHSNLSLNEMKKSIRDGIRRYFQETLIPYQSTIINELVKFFCVFETTKDFFHSQHQNTIVTEDVEMGIHFHLFITCPDNCSWVSFPSIIHYIYLELTHLPHKKLCVSKFDYDKINNLDENFILYHTKQFMFRPSVEMIMRN